ncbi:PREDICTED: histone H3-like centromeric protein cid [Drosophila arizonae]|uniref:Histone H3-like centromeric protein cid n=1 Tax=Drosophila arizonae TaxID=7263 RepID=A0ABM1PC26_DROAR|nr:PREDICTED: histone H3-like centromeric protein cid [Drosophila arizonae]
MRRSRLQNSDDSGSDLSIAFGLDGVPRCSTTRKQQKHLDKSKNADGINDNEDEDVVAVCPANPSIRNGLLPTLPCPQEPVFPLDPECPPGPACAVEPECPLEPTSSKRRKQSNPFRRAQKFKREVRLLQRTPNFMIPRISFGRVVREIMLERCDCEPHFRITMGALEALQTATEMFLTQRFQDSYMMTMHRQRVTLELRDMALMAFICKQHGLL